MYKQIFIPNINPPFLLGRNWRSYTHRRKPPIIRSERSFIICRASYVLPKKNMNTLQVNYKFVTTPSALQDSLIENPGWSHAPGVSGRNQPSTAGVSFLFHFSALCALCNIKYLNIREESCPVFQSPEPRRWAELCCGTTKVLQAQRDTLQNAEKPLSKAVLPASRDLQADIQLDCRHTRTAGWKEQRGTEKVGQ